MNTEERIARLEGFMNKFEEERIRSEERTRIEIDRAKKSSPCRLLYSSYSPDVG